MKIMQVNCVFKKGSTGKIVYDIHTELIKKNIISTVCYGRGEKIAGAYKVCGEAYSKINHFFSMLSGILYGGCLISTARLTSKISKEKPDIVHLHCINGHFINIYRLIKWLGKNKIPTVLTLHAEFMFTGSCGYSFDCNKWKENGCSNCFQWKQETRSFVGDRTSKAFKKMQRCFKCFSKDSLAVVSVSPWLYNRAKDSIILKNFKHSVVFNGIDTDIFKFYQTTNNKNNEAIIFHATPYFSADKEHIKGGYFLLELAKRLKNHPVHFYVAGNYDKNLDVPENVTMLGEIKDQKELAKLYSSADLTLLTSKRETFSMVCAESLCCGTRVLGFKAGAPETICIEKYSHFSDYGDTDELEAYIKNATNTKEDKEKIAKDAANIYGKDRMMNDYLKIYQELLNIK